MSVRRIIDLSLLGTFDATHALAELRRAGVIEPLGVEDTRRLKRLRRPAALPRPRMRGLIPGLVSLALLVAVVAAAQWPGVAPPAPRGAVIEGSALLAVRQAYETRRLRHALDAFRFVDGDWPRDLRELEASGILSPPLATGGARPYYYSRRGGNALLLAPERPAR